MPATNQPIFRSNAIKHYMEGRQKHEFPRFVSLPITILLWTLLALLVAAVALVWSEQIPMYVTSQGIVIVHSATQPSKGKPVPVAGKSAPASGKPVPSTAMAVFFFPPAQAQKIYVGEPVRLDVGSSGPQFSSQIASIEPSAMSPEALRALFHLENASLPITQPSTVVVVKLNPAFATAYAGSTVTANLQIGSQRLISLLPGVGSLFGK